MTHFKSDGQLLKTGGLFAVEGQEGFFRNNFAGHLVNQNNNGPSPQKVLGNVLGFGRIPGRPS